MRIAYLVTHPIQYQAPLLKQIAQEPGITSFKAFFASDFSSAEFIDPGFDRAIAWDVPLLDGYAHEVLPVRWGALRAGETPSFWKPFSRGLRERLAGNFDVLWVHGYSRAYHWSAMATAKRLGLRVLLRDEATLLSAERSPVKQALKRQFFSALDRFVDIYLAIGTLNLDYYKSYGIAPEKLELMPYAVDNAFFQERIAAAAPNREVLRAQLGLKPERPVILFAGKLIDRKRPLALLEAYARIAAEPAARQPYLLFAGDGPLKPALAARITAERIGGARLLGFQSQAQLAALYDLCDVFALPSERETWGLVVNEAMNAGRAILVNDRIGAGPDLVRSGQNGFVYPFGDIDALAVCLRSILRDSERLARMGERSRQLIDLWSFREDLVGLRSALSRLRRTRH